MYTIDTKRLCVCNMADLIVLKSRRAHPRNKKHSTYIFHQKVQCYSIDEEIVSCNVQGCVQVM